jgi:hypothetical protein
MSKTLNQIFFFLHQNQNIFFSNHNPPPLQVKWSFRLVWFMTFSATFNNISAISWQFYWWRKPEYPKKTTDLSQVRHTLSHNVVLSTPRHELDVESQIQQTKQIEGKRFTFPFWPGEQLSSQLWYILANPVIYDFHWFSRVLFFYTGISYIPATIR